MGHVGKLHKGGLFHGLFHVKHAGREKGTQNCFTAHWLRETGPKPAQPATGPVFWAPAPGPTRPAADPGPANQVARPANNAPR